MRYFDELATYERDGFTIIVDKTWEDTDPRGQFEESDLEEIIAKINDGTYEWFMLRVRVMLDGALGLEMGSAYLGGMLYEDPKACLTDGSAEDMIYEAMEEARKAVYPLMRKLQAINEKIEQQGVLV